MEIPLEIFGLIIGSDVSIYRSLLCIPYFARSLTVGKRFDYAVFLSP